MICPRSNALLLLLVALCTQQAYCLVANVSPSVMEGTGLLYTNMVEAGPHYDLRYIWTPVHVVLNCSTPAFTVLTASSLEQLSSESATKVLWCGWKNILSEPNVCELRFSMLRDSFFAVKPGQQGLLSIGQPELSCSVTVPDHGDRDVRVGCFWTLAAVVLFAFAGHLAQSQAFRLTTGGLMGVTGAAAIVLFVLMRSTPAKRYIGVGWAVSAGGMWSIVRWAFGTWAPGIQQVIFSPVGVWYVIITGTAGVAVTYWLDDPHSRKINTTIRVSLQIVALGALYFAVADDYVALALMGLLVCFGWLWAICRHLHTTAKWMARVIQWLQFKLGRRPRAVPGEDEEEAQLEFPLWYEEASLPSTSDDEDYSPSDSGDVDEASGGTDTGSGGADDSGDTGKEQPQPPLRQRHTAAGVHAYATAVAPAAAGRWDWLGFRRQDGGTASGTHGEELDSAPSFDDWAKKPGSSQQQPPAGRAAAAPARASSLGPAGDAAAARVAALPLPADFVLRSLDQPQHAVAPRGDQASPWRDSGKVIDFTQPKPRSPPAGPPAAGAGSSKASAAAAAVPAGRTPGGGHKVVNPETGREISTTGGTFKELLNRGYVYNAATNTLQLSAMPSPPPAAVGGNVRGAPTPASNLRSRRSGKGQ